ncbi:MAG: class A beta-lactamase-related serine hydrolase [Calditrichaeota bacterium]|nr:MAG: class A beta-lactamase-related serine hydrolase [Calditrichota bacterium]
MVKQKHIINSIVLVLLLVVAGAVSTTRAQMTEQQLRDYLERVRLETGAPSISAAVAKDGKIILSVGVGYAELENFTPASGATVHNVASISKTMAAVAVMQLVEQGKVDLDAPIQKYVPYFPKKRWPITVRHILTHTSGIRHYKEGEFGPQRIKEKMHYDKFEDAIKIWSADSLLFQPGKYWFYSSHASNLMQGIIETVTGMKFEEYMRKYVWEPANMLSTQFDVPKRIVHNRGHGYRRNQRGILENVEYVDVSYKYAGGGILSTVEDLVRFGIALNHGKLLKPKTLAMMYTVQVDPVIRFNPRGKPQKMPFKQALSWFIRTDAQGRRFISHTGSVKGTRSYFLNYPEYDLVVALIANILPLDIVKYGNAIAQAFLPPVILKK